MRDRGRHRNKVVDLTFEGRDTFEQTKGKEQFQRKIIPHVVLFSPVPSSDCQCYSCFKEQRFVKHFSK